jgi:hypothetical protein
MGKAIGLKFDNPDVPGSKLLREGLLATKDREIVYVSPNSRAMRSVTDKGLAQLG